MPFIFDILQILLNAAQWIVIIHVIMSMLISFNVINTHNELVRAVWDGLSRLLDPIYRPIRRFMPDTGALDLSPLVLLLIVAILRSGLSHLVLSYYSMV